MAAKANEQHCHEAVELAAALAAKASANTKEATVCVQESTATTLVPHTLAEDKWRQVDADAAQPQAAADYAVALVEPPLGDAAIRQIFTGFLSRP
jgi:hypothetical protein